MNRWDMSPLAALLVFALLATFVSAVALGDVVWSQPPDIHGIKVSSELIEIFALDTRIADDFRLDQTTTITRIVFWGGYYNWSDEDPDPPFNVVFYDAGDCEPMDVLANYACVRTERSFVGYDDYGFPTYEYEAAADFPVSANTTYWLMVQACDHPYPPQWGRQQSTEEPLCEAQWYAVLNWPVWEDMQDVVGIPWGASFELRGDPPTPTQPTTWGWIKASYR
jgi:hypothetical protein